MSVRFGVGDGLPGKHSPPIGSPPKKGLSGKDKGCLTRLRGAGWILLTQTSHSGNRQFTIRQYIRVKLTSAPNETATRHPPIFSGTAVPVPGLFHEYCPAPSPRGQDTGLKPGCQAFFGVTATPRRHVRCLWGVLVREVAALPVRPWFPPENTFFPPHKAFFPVLPASMPKARLHQSATP